MPSSGEIAYVIMAEVGGPESLGATTGYSIYFTGYVVKPDDSPRQGVNFRVHVHYGDSVKDIRRAAEEGFAAAIDGADWTADLVILDL